MSDWGLFIQVCELLGTLALLLTLQWAAVERARVHRAWTARRRVSRAPVDWYVTISVAVGCV